MKVGGGVLSLAIDKSDAGDLLRGRQNKKRLSSGWPDRLLVAAVGCQRGAFDINRSASGVVTDKVMIVVMSRR
jgi:hypothetical protein